MVKKADFVKTLQAIQAEKERQRKAHAELRNMGLSIDWNETPYLTALLDLLKAAVPDPYDYISWWLFEDVDHVVTWEENGETVTANLNNPGDLYDYLTGPNNWPEPDKLPFVEVPDRHSDLVKHIGIDKVDFQNYMDAVFDYLDKHDVIIHIMEDGKSEYLLISAKRYEAMFGPLEYEKPDEKPEKPEMVTVEIEVDAELAEQAEKQLKPMGFTLEQACEMFLTWCAHYPDDATAWIKWAMEEEKARENQSDTRPGEDGAET